MHRSPDSRASAIRSGARQPWWRTAVFYQVYVRSFADSDGDGVGDLAGIRDQLGYLHLLGVDALWLTPFYPSPMADHGYDVADPRDVDPLFGTLADFDALVADAHALGLKVTIDLVPNHTSDRHAWFAAALAAAPGSPERATVRLPRRARAGRRASRRTTGTSIFGGPAWTRVAGRAVVPAPVRGRAARPGLDATRRWRPTSSDRCGSGWTAGVDGFRIDVAHGHGQGRGPAATWTGRTADHGRPTRRAAATRASTWRRCTTCTG